MDAYVYIQSFGSFKNEQALTNTEESLIRAISNQTFNVPEPMKLYLSGIGNVISKTGQHIVNNIYP